MALMGFILLDAIILASINYAPWWWKSASDQEQLVRSSLVQIDTAYSLVTRLNNGEPPVPLAAPDGGLMSNFGSYLKLAPAAPRGFQWAYGQHADDGSAYAGLNYFCMNSNSQLDEASVRGILRAKSLYGANQAFFASTCGATANTIGLKDKPSGGALTFYVVYTPGVTP